MTRAVANTATGNVLIDAMLKQNKWDLTTDLNDLVTFSFPGAVTHYAKDQTNYEPYLFNGDAVLDLTALNVPAGATQADVYNLFTTTWGPANTFLQTAARAAFAQIGEVAGIAFAEKSATDSANYYVNPGNNKFDGVDISIGMVDLDSGGFGFQPGGGRRNGDVFFDTNPNRFGNNNKALVKGSNDYRVVLHEIGHALGLRHGHEGNAGSDLNASLVLPQDQDTMEFSLMTYRMYVGMPVPEGFTYTSGVEQFGFAQSLMMLDIQALQYMYGADFTTNATDSVYTFSSSTGEMKINGVSQGTPGANRVFLTVWDGGGVDTYDFSNYTTKLSIDLAPGSYTNLGTQLAKIGGADTTVTTDDKYARGNVFNAFQYQGNAASLIENAKGGSNDDVINGNDAANVLTGGKGKDTLFGGDGIDTLDGGDGDDTLMGGLDTDTIIGGKGNDLIIYIEGDVADTIDGGTEIDTLDLSANATSALVDLSGGTWTPSFKIFGGSTPSRTIANVENVFGGASADGLVGNDLANILNGGGGNDTLVGGKGNDTYGVDAAGDTVTENAGEGTDTISTTLTSFDLSSVANVENLSYAGKGNFNGTGSAVANVITGGNGLIGKDGGNDYLDGGADVQVDTNGDGKVDSKDAKIVDTLIGGNGNDVYVVRDLNDVIVEAAGTAGGIDAVASYLNDYALAPTVEWLSMRMANSGRGTGNALDNAIYGTQGSGDILKGMAGNDYLNGSYWDSDFDTSNDKDAPFDNLQDQLEGGQGNDTYALFGNNKDIVVEKAGEGSDTVLVSLNAINLGDAAYANVENATYVYTGGGGSLSFTATGTAAANTLVGSTLGADTLTGLDGDDRLDGGENTSAGGNHVDTLVGGKGNDTYLVRNGLEVIDETGGLATDKDTVESWIYGFGLDTRGKLGDVNARANLENVTIKGGASGQSRWASGNEGVNVLTGGITNDLLDGGWKYDTVDTGMEITDGAVDTLIGGLGDDSYVIRDTKDKLVELADTKTVTGQGTDTIIIDMAVATSYTLGANFENLTLYYSTESKLAAHNGTGNKADNQIFGNDGTNILKGLDGNDTLAGNGGADTLIGGNGNDELFGGLGADSFVLDAKLGPTNIDTIYGFSAGDGDKIHLQDSVMAGIKNDPVSGFLDAQYFLSAASGHVATASQQRIIHDQASHTLWYDKDGSGVAAAVQIATMGENVLLAAGDFKVI